MVNVSQIGRRPLTLDASPLSRLIDCLIVESTSGTRSTAARLPYRIIFIGVRLASWAGTPPRARRIVFAGPGSATPMILMSSASSSRNAAGGAPAPLEL